MPEKAPLAIVLVAGLHADVRRETVAELLADLPDAVALHHDLRRDAAGLIERVVRDTTGAVDRVRLPLPNDCSCCGMREDLLPLLRTLAAGGRYRTAVVETWESVDPQETAELIDEHGGEALKLVSVVTAVDPAQLVHDLSHPADLADRGLAMTARDDGTVGEVLARQVEYAPVLACPVTPDIGPGDELLRLLHPAARVTRLGAGRLAALTQGSFSVAAAADAVHAACAQLPYDEELGGVMTAVWHRRRPLHPGRLYEALEDIVLAALRSRGRIWLASRPDELLSWGTAGGNLTIETAGPWLAAVSDETWDAMPPVRRAAAALDWDPLHGDRCQQVAFTAPGLDRDPLFGVLDACLLTDAEFARGPAFWRTLADPFAVFLDVPV